MTALAKRYLSPAEYLEIEELAEFRSEYYRGQMTRRGDASVDHCALNSNLVFQLNLALREGPWQVMSSIMRVKVEAAEFYSYPDTVLVRQPFLFENLRQSTLLNPAFLCEIASG